MKSAAAKKEIELALADRFGAIFERRQKQPAETISTGIEEIDARLHGFPRGAITEIHGATSSGRTSLMMSALAGATRQQETCALVDTSDTFDLLSAANARVDCDRLLWVRCSGSLERAFKATDLLLQSGGFGLVVLNLADVAAKYTRRIITSWWFRFRRALENTPTVLVVVTPVSCTRSCAALVLEVKNEGLVWPGTRSIALEKEALKESHSRSRLALVTETPLTSPLTGQFAISAPLTHSHLLQGIRIRVNQERPVSWSHDPLRFQTHLH
jgi:hypothetical protein